LLQLLQQATGKGRLLTDLNLNNLDPQNFVFWQPSAGSVVHVGPEQHPVPLPEVPLPVRHKAFEDGSPDDSQIGEGVYDYLRQFPDCLHNTVYAELLRDAYPHYLADLAAHVVMLDKKDVEPAYVFRKLTYLKLLRLLEPENASLLWQLAQGFYGLALTFTELPYVRQYLLNAMRFGQETLKAKPDDTSALNLLAEIDILFGDYPTAVNRFRKLLELLDDEQIAERISLRLDTCLEVGFPDHPLIDDLELVAKAMQLYTDEHYPLATELLERLEEDDYFVSELKSADFLCLLGMCRIKTGDRAGAFDALSQALELTPDHEQAREVIETI
jgi:tetratricopeptide (TPR) repeat protein